ncbi:MAG TPA: L-threonylcarbamoyladenylate synthase [Gemmataceae bacterium]|jgi:L-threonylcarbamoyladenylate synthase
MSCVLPVDPGSPDPAVIAEAAAVLRRGGLVAFPTETVYGVGANALDPAAVRRIFAAKGRPPTNPIIVHVADVADLGTLTQPRSPDTVARLAERFWPGPLTLVLPKAAAVPDVVTAGGPTVAVRIPAHPVALALLRAASVPLAAPSANRSTELSPTTAGHVLRGLGGRIDLILDGGPTAGGIESTVLDVSADPPRLLRPGLVTPAMIEAVIGPMQRTGRPAAGPARSPGQMAKHYAPRAPLELAAGDGRPRVAELAGSGVRVGWLTWPGTDEVAGAVRVTMPADAAGYAARLYAALHDLDAAGVERIVVAEPPPGDDWLAVRDRLRRAEEKK